MVVNMGFEIPCTVADFSSQTFQYIASLTNVLQVLRS